jgi:cytoskeletal protein RodZ
MRKISDILKEEREKKGYTIQEVEEQTKIKKDFIRAIEDGRFYDLPSEAYALGFVKNYAEFLGIPQKKASALFRREYEGKNLSPLPKFSALSFSKTLFGLRTLFIIGTILTVVGYIFFQYNSLFFGPPLEIFSPKNHEVAKSNIITISGKTDPYATILINGDDVYVDVSGRFQKSLYLFEGRSKISIVAKNRFGKETRKELEVVVK